MNKTLLTSNSSEWYTPAPIIRKARAVMGAIDLDPCSNSKTDPNVPAGRHYTKADNGLKRTWQGRVYLNPPYGREIGRWIDKLLSEHRAGRVTQAVALLPSRTDTDWYHKLTQYPRCNVKGRLKFSGHQNGAPFPSVVFYLGSNLQEFYTAFSPLGEVVVNLSTVTLNGYTLRFCEHCNAPFIPTRRDEKYHAGRCKVAAHRKGVKVA